MQLLILGANSHVARATAAEFAHQEGAGLYLASRDMPLLENKCRDIAIRYRVNAVPLYFDACRYDTHKDFYDRLSPKPDVVLLAFGYMDPSWGRPSNFHDAKQIIEANFLGAVSILEIVAADFSLRGRGTVIGISSVAGERGRQSNYIYGAAKAGLTVYLSGLRNRLYARGVAVITVIPGFVHTKMTEGLQLPKLLTASPEKVAKDIYGAYRKRRSIVYSSWFWRWIMLAIKLLPENLFRRLRL